MAMTGNQLSLSTNNGYIMSTTETTSPEMWERTAATELEFIAMLSGECKYMQSIQGMVSPKDFYWKAMGKCFKFLQEKYDCDGGYIPSDLLKFVAKEGEEVLSSAKKYITAGCTITEDGLKARAQLIRRYSLCRQVKQIAGELLSIAPDTVSDTVDKAIRGLSDITEENDSHRSEPISVADIIGDYLNEIFSGKPRECFSTKYKQLDNIIAMSKGDLVVVAARPGMGKSAFAGNMAINFAEQGYKTIFFNLEMETRQEMDRLFANMSQIPCDVLANNAVNNEYSKQASVTGEKIFHSLPTLFIDDSTYETVSEIKRKCVKNKAQVIIIDYLQLLSPDFKSDNSNKTYEIGEITRRLKIMAGELGALVILLSQLNRSVETRAINRPILSDLRDSGAIEQDATGVVFLSRVDSDDKNSDILVDVAKNRYGEIGQVIFGFNRATQTLYETENKYIPQKKKVRNYAD